MRLRRRHFWLGESSKRARGGRFSRASEWIFDNRASHYCVRGVLLSSEVWGSFQSLIIASLRAAQLHYVRYAKSIADTGNDSWCASATYMSAVLEQVVARFHLIWVPISRQLETRTPKSIKWALEPFDLNHASSTKTKTKVGARRSKQKRKQK